MNLNRRNRSPELRRSDCYGDHGLLLAQWAMAFRVKPGTSVNLARKGETPR